MTKNTFFSIWLCFVFVLSTATLNSCSKENEEHNDPTLVGTWVKTSNGCGEMTLVFNSNNTFNLGGIDCEGNDYAIEGDYTYSGSTVTLTYEDDDDGVPDTFPYSFVDSNTLSVQMGETVIFTRQ